MRIIISILILPFFIFHSAFAQKAKDEKKENKPIYSIKNGKSILTENCNNWLKTGSHPGFFRVGDLDIIGDQITVEATFNRTTQWPGSDLYQGDLVSKHDGPDDCNYLLRPGSAEITTEHGYYKTPEICAIELNKTYHAAMVYDGKSLKFYRNGFLMSERAASGNLVLNDWETQIGLYYNEVVNTQFTGYINEVRIWNIARSQQQLKDFMDKSLSNPTRLTGLQAYYTFDGLNNKQGNAAWNGSIHGNASVNQTNAACNFVADSCGIKSCQDTRKIDFSFQQEICDPSVFSFYTHLQNQSSATWYIDGKISTGANPGKFTLPETGKNYIIRLITETQDQCKDTLEKLINYELKAIPLISANDSSFCPGDTVTIKGNDDLIRYCWNIPTQIGNITGLQGTLQPKESFDVNLTGLKTGINLFLNGDFFQGNKGFISGLPFDANNSNTGYKIQNHLNGTGKESCIEGASVSNNIMLAIIGPLKTEKLWEQTISVAQNTNYVFHAKYLPLTTGKNVQIKVLLNGIEIVAPFVIAESGCLWSQQLFMWNSGNETEVNLQIQLMNEHNQSIKFALDDLHFGKAEFSKDQKSFTKNPTPSITLPADTGVCIGSSLTLTGKTESNDYKIIWYEAGAVIKEKDFELKIAPEKNTVYSASVINNYGCTTTDSVAVDIYAKPSVSLPDEIKICSGEKATPNFLYTNVDKAKWYPETGIENIQSLQPSFRPTLNTQFFVDLTSKEGCISSDSLLLTVASIPAGTVTKDGDLNCEKASVQLQASGGSKYEWFPSDGLNSTNISNPVASPRQVTTYTVKVTNEDNCSIEIPITINISGDGKNGYFIPNAFSPNADGNNDCFGIKNWGGIQEFSFVVYNRWGQQLFFTKNQNECWNGQFKNVLQPNGVYVYYIQAKTLCGDVSRKGTVMLVR